MDIYEYSKLYNSILKGVKNETIDYSIDYYKRFIIIEDDTLTIRVKKCETIELDNSIIDLSKFKEIKIKSTETLFILFKKLNNCKIEVLNCTSKRINISNINNCDIELHNSVSIVNQVIFLLDSYINKFVIASHRTEKPLKSLQVFATLTKDKIGNINYLLIKDIYLEHLEIDTTNINLLHINNIELNKFSLHDTKINDIEFRSSTVNNSVFFLNLAPIKYAKKIRKILIEWCTLPDNILFSLCDFSKYSFSLIENDISNAKISACILPTKVYTENKDNYTLTDFYSYQKDTILQLRSLAENKNDNYALHQIKSLEHEVNYNLLKVKENPITWQDRYNKIVLGLNKITTNHGRNWLLPIGLYLVISVLIYWGIASLNCQAFDLNKYSIFLNPTHKISSVFGEIKNLNQATGLLDYGTRIIFAYLAVQTVTTFRKILK